MFDIFPDHPSYEYPSLVNVIYTLIWAFVLSSIVAITHRLTYTGENYPKHFFQSMVLGSIVTAMLMMAIGDSLARGLGVFGAMAIIRFRTRIDDPRNVLFLFAALSSGLAIGVYGYATSFAGTLIFCAVAGILHFTNFRSNYQNDNLYFTLADPEKLPQMLQLVTPFVSKKSLINVSINKNKETRYEYQIVLNNYEEKHRLLQEMNHVEGVSQLKISNTSINNC